MTVADVLSDLFKNENKVCFRGKILNLKDDDMFRVVLGNDEHIYKFFWAECMADTMNIPERILKYHVNETKLSFARGNILFDCLAYPSKEYIKNFNERVGIYERG